MQKRQTKTHKRLIFFLENRFTSNWKIALNIHTKAVHMPSILVMDWQVARQLEISVLDVVIEVGFTESKNVWLVFEHKCFKICEVTPQTSYIGVAKSKRWW
jgi:hypothetical protein